MAIATLLSALKSYAIMIRPRGQPVPQITALSVLFTECGA